MNVYQCWYLGLEGYCCRCFNSRWMFIPELGQTNKKIQKHVSFNDLNFNNAFAKEYESKIEHNLEKIRAKPFYFIRLLFFPVKKSISVEGMLFTTI